MKLYEIDRELYLALQELNPKVDEETGEIIEISTEQMEEAEKKIEELNLAKDEKIENLALLLKNLQADVDAFKKEKENLAKRQSQTEDKIEWIKGYLEHSLQGEKFETTRCKISWRKSQKVEVNEELLPDTYFRIKKEADKTLLKKILKDGFEIEGAKLVETNSI